MVIPLSCFAWSGCLERHLPCCRIPLPNDRWWDLGNLSTSIELTCFPTECLADGGERVLAVDEEQQEGKLRQIMTNKAVHLISFFLLIYVGVEVTIGGRFFVLPKPDLHFLTMDP